MTVDSVRLEIGPQVECKVSLVDYPFCGHTSGHVREFRRRNCGRWQRMTLDADEFLRRFLQHVLPPRFMRVRTFGFFANRRRGETLARIRWLLGVSQTAADAPIDRPSTPRLCCPYCGQDALRLIGETPRPSLAQLVARTYHPKAPDSS